MDKSGLLIFAQRRVASLFFLCPDCRTSRAEHEGLKVEFKRHIDNLPSAPSDVRPRRSHERKALGSSGRQAPFVETDQPPAQVI